MMTDEAPLPPAPAAPPVVEAAPARVATFTAADRCDACASQAERAYVGVMVNGTELLFCAHHYAIAELSLAPYMFDPASVRDERWQLYETESTRTTVEPSTGLSDQCMMQDHRHCSEPDTCVCKCHGRNRS